jgi:hypothetical protein
MTCPWPALLLLLLWCCKANSWVGVIMIIPVPVTTFSVNSQVD